MTPRTRDVYVKPYELPLLDTLENTCPHRSAQSYRGERHRNNYWQCCKNGKVMLPMTPESAPDKIDLLAESEHKRFIQEYESDVYQLHKLMNNIAVDDSKISGKVPALDQACKEFQEHVVAYDNVLSFCSEQANVDHKHSGWAIYCCQEQFLHNIGTLLPGDGEKFKFLQIRHIDANQEALERRMESVIGGDVLNIETLRSMTRLL